jgi:nucleoside-diphosphate-sugar epimerase
MTTGTTRRLAIYGISSQAAGSLVSVFGHAGYAIHGISRNRDSNFPGVAMHHFDPAAGTLTPRLPDIEVLVSQAPLPALPGLLRTMESGSRPARIIAFGTTGIFSKADSASPDERAFVKSQLGAEKDLAAWSARHGVYWTVLRPTMMYGVNRDQNVAFIRSTFRRFRCFPIPFGARGVRQPVHVEDLASACLAVLSRPQTRNKAYNLGGGEVLLYEDLVRRIRIADGHVPVLVPIPRSLYYCLVFLARVFLGQSHLRIAMVDRMYADLVADNSAAVEDFGFSPRPFEPPGPS